MIIVLPLYKNKDSRTIYNHFFFSLFLYPSLSSFSSFLLLFFLHPLIRKNIKINFTSKLRRENQDLLSTTRTHQHIYPFEPRQQEQQQKYTTTHIHQRHTWNEMKNSLLLLSETTVRSIHTKPRLSKA
jgi:hypothetical protein